MPINNNTPNGGGGGQRLIPNPTAGDIVTVNPLGQVVDSGRAFYDGALDAIGLTINDIPNAVNINAAIAAASTGFVKIIGNWDASTNTPTLTLGVGTAGTGYYVSVAGTQTLPFGTPTACNVNDVVYYPFGGGAWQLVPASQVTSVNGQVGAVVINIGAHKAMSLSTTNVDITNPGTSIFDFVVLSVGDPLFLPFQTDPTENGLWIFNGSSVPLTRSPDMNTYATVAGVIVAVQSSATYNAGSVWRSTNYGTGTLGVTAIDYLQQPNRVSAAGTGVSINSFTYEISIGQDVAPSADVSFNTVTANSFIGNSTTSTLATNIAGGGVNYLPYNSALNTTTFLAPSTGVLYYNGSALSYSTTPTLTGTNFSGIPNSATTATSANTVSTIVARDGSGNFSAGTITANVTGTSSLATNVAGGAANQILYQSASNVTAKLTAATGVLVYTGSALAYTTTPTLTGTNFTGIPLTTAVTGILPVANGGSGTSTAFTAGSIVFAGASGVYSQNNTRLFWDNTAQSLGIGTNNLMNPSGNTNQSKLYVDGNIGLRGAAGGGTWTNQNLLFGGDGSGYSMGIGSVSNAGVINARAVTILDNRRLGIATTIPLGTFSASPIQYNTGTASQSGNAITGSGTTFTSAMVGSQFIFADGTNGGFITAFGSTTSLTVSTSQTVASQAYNIHYIGLQVSTTGKVGINTSAPVSTSVMHVKTSGVSNDLGLYIDNFGAAAGWGMTFTTSGATDTQYIRLNNSAGTQLGYIGTTGTLANIYFSGLSALATSIAGGASSQAVIQTAANTTSFLSYTAAATASTLMLRDGNGDTSVHTITATTNMFSPAFTIDSNYYATLSSSNPFLNLDNGDYMLYNRSTNVWQFVINSVNILQLTNGGSTYSAIVSGGGNGGMQVNGGNGGTGTVLRASSPFTDGAWGPIFYSESASGVALMVAGTRNVGIRTASPNQALEIGGTNTTIRIANASAGTGTSLIIDGNGDVRPLTSSQNFKENIKKKTFDTSKLSKVEPIEYDYKEEFGGEHDIGLLAESLYKLYPELINLKEGKPYSVKYDRLSLILLQKINELDQKINALK